MKRWLFLLLLAAAPAKAQKRDYSNASPTAQFSLPELKLYGRVKSILIEKYSTRRDRAGQEPPFLYECSAEAGYQLFFDNNRHITRQITYDLDQSILSDVSYYNYLDFIIRDAEWPQLNEAYHTNVDTASRTITGITYRDSVAVSSTTTQYTYGFRPKTVYHIENRDTVNRTFYDYNGVGQVYRFIFLSPSSSHGYFITFDGWHEARYLYFSQVHDTAMVSDNANDYTMEKVNSYSGDRLKSTYRYFEHQKPAATEVIIYNAQHRIVETRAHDYATFREYNGRDLLTSYKRTDLGERVTAQTLYSYNRHSDLSSIKNVFDETENRDYSYEYDRYGNWITRLEYINKKLFSKTIRTIAYF